MLTHSCVYYEESKQAAEARLEKLREASNAIEIKAYILRVAPKQFRVLRKIQIPEVQKTHVDKLKEACHQKKGL